MENNESFASPKEETPIINQLEETIVEWLKSGDENATNLAYQIFFKHLERKETPASKEEHQIHDAVKNDPVAMFADTETLLIRQLRSNLIITREDFIKASVLSETNIKNLNDAGL